MRSSDAIRLDSGPTRDPGIPPHRAGPSDAGLLNPLLRHERHAPTVPVALPMPMPMPVLVSAPGDTRRACANAASETAWFLRSKHRLVAVAALSLGLQAHALQVLEASDGVAVEGVISIKEPTRIRIEGAAITDVFGNIHSSHCGEPTSGAGITPLPSAAGVALASATLNPTGEVVLVCDKDKGEVYVRPVGGGDKPINLFVSSAAATYTLLLRRADTPADTLLIRDKTPRALRRGTGEGAAAAGMRFGVNPGPAGSAGSAPSHVRGMKALLVAMASDRVPPDMRVEETLHSMRLWSETNFSLLRTYEGRGLLGELYLLQNVGARTLDLAEQQFDRADGPITGEVAGVAIDRRSLPPGETTRVYVIRRGGTP